MKGEITLKGRIRLECYRKGVKVWDTGFVNNIITNVGLAAVAGLTGNTGSITAFTYLAIGTSATAVAATDTTLGAEITDSGLTRSAATVSRVTTAQTNDTLQLTFTWTASGSKTVQEAGIFNASSSGIMLAHALTGAKAVVSSDILVGTYKVAFQ